MKSVSVVLLLVVGLAAASPLEKRLFNSTAASAASYAGVTSTDVFPPTGTTAGGALFPDESEIGYPGVTMTGAEPFAIQTQPPGLYPANTAPFAPLVNSPISGETNSSNFSIFTKWGNLSPWFTVNSSFYGLPNASPVIPQQCDITQVHLLYRHGARYPTSGSLPFSFAGKVQNASTMGGFKATGDLAFLNTWTFKLGAELLTPFGRQQNFDLGIAFRQQYGRLLNNFTEQGVLPVFRTESQDRMVKTALNFAAGFFGVPEYQDEVNIEIIVEAEGFNNTGAPYEVCTNADVASKGSIGSAAATNFSRTAFASTVNRLQSMVTGLNLTTTDVVSMLQLCSYETDALGYSAFCRLFTEEDYANYEYYYDISFYYNNGFGSPVAAAQGLGFLQEFISRLGMTRLTEFNSTTNKTLDSNPLTFPLNQSIYADASHEVVILDTLTALNLTALFSSGPLPIDARPASHSFIASQVVPFGTHLVMQVLECSDMTPTKQMRFIVNDAVLPISDSYAGCPKNSNGLCPFDTVLAALIQRAQDIDFQQACFGNYTAQAGMDYNGLAPKS